MEIHSQRLLNQPVETVFTAFADPEQLTQWWGPSGFNNTFAEFDFRPRGHWRFTMHGPDGSDYPNHKQFIEIVPNERIVFQHIHETHAFRMTMSYANLSGKTQLSWHMQFESTEPNLPFKEFITQANEQNFDRLETFLTSHTQP